MKIYIVIPYYNERKHIQGVISDILSKNKHPIVVIDDGSSDGGLDDLVNSKVTLIRHGVNLGKGAAMKTGAEYAFAQGADAVIFMDSDGQHRASDLSKFIYVLNERKCDIVFGTRNLSMGVPVVRYFGNKIASIVVSILFGIYVSDSICGFRAVTKRGYLKTKWNSMGYGVEVEMVARAGKFGLKTFEVPVETIYHDHVKGVTILDAFGIFVEVVKLKLTL